MNPLTRETLEPLREALRARGQRPSMVADAVGEGPRASHELIEALRLVEEWGAFCEAMYLMMVADQRVMNVEREVLRGALAVLSNDTVRTRHMEAMLDAAMRKVAAEGAERRLAKVIEALRSHPARAESAVVVAAAIAAADDQVVPEEHALLRRLAAGLEIDPSRAAAILGELTSSLKGGAA